MYFNMILFGFLAKYSLFIVQYYHIKSSIHPHSGPIYWPPGKYWDDPVLQERALHEHY